MKNRLKGISYAALSSATFGLAPFFTVSLLNAGLSPWEVLTYRWGTASVALALFGFMAGLRFRVSGQKSRQDISAEPSARRRRRSRW